MRLVTPGFCDRMSRLYWCVFRGEGSTQRSHPDHPSQLRSDQHGGAQHYSGLPAQHSQVKLVAALMWKPQLHWPHWRNSAQACQKSVIQPLCLAVRSVRPGVSPSSWMDASLSGTLWRPWCSCCRYKYLKTCNSSTMPGPDMINSGLLLSKVAHLGSFLPSLMHIQLTLT